MNMQTQYGAYPYVYPIEAAQHKCRERYPGFKIISGVPKWLFPNKDAFTLCYAYFRWFDDIVDSLRLHPEESRFIIERQKRFLSQLYSEESPEELSTEELFLAHLVRFDKIQGKGIKKDLEILVGSLEFDANRRGRMISSVELEQYIDDNVVPYINISAATLNVHGSLKQDLRDVSRAGFVIDYLFDLREDIASGYVNIPLEEMEKYGIELDVLEGDKLQVWMRDKMETLREVLFDTRPFRNLSPLARIIAESMAWKRRRKFRKIESNDYYPR